MARRAKTPAANERYRRLGKRMEMAARAAGFLTTQAMSEVLDVAQPTVSRWWRGVQRPSLEQLDQYGEQVGRPAWWFLMDSKDDAEFARLAETTRRVFGFTVGGEGLAAAFDRATGRPDLLTRPERRRLNAGSPALRERISQVANGRWEELPPERQDEILDYLIASGLLAEEE